jgi:hypothetical protein
MIASFLFMNRDPGAESAYRFGAVVSILGFTGQTQVQFLAMSLYIYSGKLISC